MEDRAVPLKYIPTVVTEVEKKLQHGEATPARVSSRGLSATLLHIVKISRESRD